MDIAVRASLALALLTPWHLPSWAWSGDGHRVTGHVAVQLLTPAAKANLRELLGHDDLAAVATWMDDERQAIAARWPESPRWHYENRSVCGAINPQACAHAHCITVQLTRFIDALKDADAKHQERKSALRVVVHLVGDLHQPLHLADNGDRGGNDLWVSLPTERQPIRLHELWDRTLLRQSMARRSSGRASATYARALLQQHDENIATWQRGGVVEWARETSEVGARSSYHALPNFSCQSKPKRDPQAVTLTKEYLDTARAVVDVQLVKAGARLAAVLNDALGEHSLR